ncbi:MAG: zinc-ribbon domain-containing protein, partial [Clostridia bacterium]|nr:zinc-ribbon domain-containing protein [Clostridia bacterium]
GASLLGVNGGYNVERGTDIISERFQGMSPEWQREHEKAFEFAQNEAKAHFQRCHNCRQWVCEADFNEEEGLCVECAPRMNVEIAHAKAEKMVEDIKAKAAETTVFSGKIESKQIICPVCGKPSGQGKFCNNCGANLSLSKCPTCGAQNQAGARFCSECGTNLQ